MIGSFVKKIHSRTYEYIISLNLRKDIHFLQIEQEKNMYKIEVSENGKWTIISRRLFRKSALLAVKENGERWIKYTDGIRAVNSRTGSVVAQCVRHII